MESIRYILTPTCGATCARVADQGTNSQRDLHESLGMEALRDFEMMLANLPPSMRYTDLRAASPEIPGGERIGRFVLSGCGILADPLLTVLTFPVVDRLVQRYKDQGGVRIVVHSAGADIDGAAIAELSARGVEQFVFSWGEDGEVAGGESVCKRDGVMPHSLLRDKLASTTPELGGSADGEVGLEDSRRAIHGDPHARHSPHDVAIGALLGRFGIPNGFCNSEDGGVNFLRHRYNGSKVLLHSNGDVFQCVKQTSVPLGNLREESLIRILEDLEGMPAFEAISAGRPERMGLSDGWSEERMYEAGRVGHVGSTACIDLCVACQFFHREVLGPRLREARNQRTGASDASLRRRVWTILQSYER